MAALSYLLLPVTGAASFFWGPSARVRFHGLQAVVIGALWPLALYAASAVSPVLTRVVFACGALLWAGFMVATAVGKDPVLPGLGRFSETPG